MIPKLSKIVPHIWFNQQAKEAVTFYTSLFSDSKIKYSTTISNTPSGSIDIYSFQLMNVEFMAMNADSPFQLNQALSFFVYCGSESEIDRIYTNLSDGGTVLMSLNSYPWSKKYAFIIDKFGLSWQLDIDPINHPQKIVPTFLFVNEKMGRIKEAYSFYEAIFENPKLLVASPYDLSENLPDGTLLFAQFKLSNYIINTMSSKLSHDFDVNESISLMLYCQDQEAIDYYWGKLSNGGHEQACGWLKDRFGISWQIVSEEMDKMLTHPDKKTSDRVIAELLKMKKIDLNILREAWQDL